MSLLPVVNLNELLRGLADSSFGAVDVTGLSLDSRTAKTGDLFIALSGTREDGRRFIADAIASGAVAVVYDAEGELSAEYSVPVVRVPDLVHKAGVIAERFYDHPSRKMFMVGVTGTNGKTSCSHFISQALDSKDTRCAVIGTLGNGLSGALEEATHTTPDAVTLHGMLAEFEKMTAQQVVMEVSSHGLEQGRVSGVDFDVAVFTNLSRDHLDYHGDMESYGRAKARLFHMPKLNHAVINGDDEFGQRLLNDIPDRVKTVVYTLSDDQFDVPTVRGCDLQLTRDGMTMLVETPWGSGKLSSALLGRFNASNLLAVVTTLLISGVGLDECLRKVATLETVPGRVERFGQHSQPLVVIDYAHTPDALQQVLMTLRDHCLGQLWCVFGCGGDRDQGKRPLMGEIAVRYANKVVLTDDNPRHESAEKIIADIKTGIADLNNVVVIRNRAKAIRQSVMSATENDIVLIAGKGHEDYQLVGDEKTPFSDRDEVVAALKEAA